MGFGFGTRSQETGSERTIYILSRRLHPDKHEPEVTGMTSAIDLY